MPDFDWDMDGHAPFVYKWFEIALRSVAKSLSVLNREDH